MTDQGASHLRAFCTLAGVSGNRSICINIKWGITLQIYALALYYGLKLNQRPHLTHPLPRTL
jgi:hypothetical protein